MTLASLTIVLVFALATLSLLGRVRMRLRQTLTGPAMIALFDAP